MKSGHLLDKQMFSTNLNRQALGYSFLAPAYSFLTQIVYRKNMQVATLKAVESISKGDQVLIIGGGDGKILLPVLAKEPSHITYVEMSSGMMQKAQRKWKTRPQNHKGMPIDFILDTYPVSKISAHFDKILTPFVCDTLEQDFLVNEFVPGIQKNLVDGGRWINLDFRHSAKSEYWYRMHLWLIHQIFKLICGIKRTSLPSMESIIHKTSFYQNHKQEIGWFDVSVYQKR